MFRRLFSRSPLRRHDRRSTRPIVIRADLGGLLPALPAATEFWSRLDVVEDDISVAERAWPRAATVLLEESSDRRHFSGSTTSPTPPPRRTGSATAVMRPEGSTSTAATAPM